MKKIAIKTTCILIITLALVTTAFADYTDGPENNEYNRTRASQYIYNYTITPNSVYYDFTNVGGDCTNFVSQVLAEGGMQMTYSVSEPTLKDWYYFGSVWGYERSATWTNAHCFSYYWIDINGIGAKKAYSYVKYNANDLKDIKTWHAVFCYLEPGDVIQYVNYDDNITYHSQVVHRTSYENGEFKISVGQHTNNGWRNLRNYIYTLPEDTIICFIKIKQPASKDAGFMKGLSKKTISELEASEDLLYNMNPCDTFQENEKWSELSAIKEELIKRAKRGAGIGEHIIPVSKEVLINFINIRIENNNNIQNSIKFNYGLNRRSVKTITECCEENSELKALLFDVSAVNEKNKGKINRLWKKFWKDIINQPPPSFYQ